MNDNQYPAKSVQPDTNKTLFIRIIVRDRYHPLVRKNGYRVRETNPMLFLFSSAFFGSH
jgi:hypothetical protein